MRAQRVRVVALVSFGIALAMVAGFEIARPGSVNGLLNKAIPGRAERQRQERAAKLAAEKLKQKQQAASEAKLKSECQAIDQGIASARQHGHADILPADAGCYNIEFGDCRVRVELAVELSSDGAALASAAIAGIDDSCAGEHAFARTYGIAAFRDHWKLQEAANELAVEEARQDDIDAAQAMQENEPVTPER